MILWQTFLDGCPADFGALSCEVTSISPYFRKLVGWWNNSSIQICCSPAAGKYLRWRMFKELDVDNNNSLDANEIRAPCLHLWALNQKYVREMSLEIFRVYIYIYKHENKIGCLVMLCFQVPDLIRILSEVFVSCSRPIFTTSQRRWLCLSPATRAGDAPKTKSQRNHGRPDCDGCHGSDGS